jgi:anti-anti-sigma factor
LYFSKELFSETIPYQGQGASARKYRGCREVIIKFDIRSVGIFDVVSARLADGEVFDSAKLKNTVRFLIENDMRNVVIDLGNLEYLYSDTINAFIASNRHMLEVSGRIAILTEHPKVQDILKRAGLDNIMRIYRSEAEMIADSKEILRQTSSYRIEELQKISSQPGDPPPMPKTEFDEFKAEMGQRLGSKLDNNELPQYQLGLNANAPAPTYQAPAAPSEHAYPTFNPPGGFAPTQLPESPGPGGFTQAQPATAYNYNTNAYGSGNGAQGYPNPGSAQGFGQPQANFDFPTVQLPVGQLGNLSQPPPSAPAAGGGHGQMPPSQSTGYDSEIDPADPRQRKPSQDRMRSPNARKQPGRRVGGREFGGQEEEAIPAYVEEERQAEPQREEKYSSYSDLPPARSNSLVEEARFPAKLIIFVLLLGLGVGVYFFLIRKSGPAEPPNAIETPSVPQPEVAQPAAPEAQPAVPTPPPTATAPAPTAPAEPAAAPQTGVAEVRPAPAQPSPAPAAQPTAPAKPAKTLAETPKPSAPKPQRTAMAHPARQPKPRVERPAPAPAEESAPAPKAGVLHITSEPEGAEVLVNFSKKGVTPLDVNLSNNSNKIIVRMSGYKRFETTLPKNSPERDLEVTLEKEGGDEPVAKTPPPKPAPEPEERRPEPKYDDPEELPMAKAAPARDPDDEPKPRSSSAPTPGDGPIGIIFLSSSPARADIFVDGKNTGKKTPAKLELPSGQHRIEMNRSGQKSSIDQIVNEGKNKALHLILQ